MINATQAPGAATPVNEQSAPDQKEQVGNLGGRKVCKTCHDPDDKTTGACVCRCQCTIL